MTDDISAELLQNVSRCGLVCYGCAGFIHGAIVKNSKELLHYLEGYIDFIEEKVPDAAEAVKGCVESLNYWSGQQCGGCRSNSCYCKYKNCPIPECMRNKKFNFCYECEEFPCDKLDHIPELKDRWLQACEDIQTYGIENYYIKQKLLPHYYKFKK